MIKFSEKELQGIKELAATLEAQAVEAPQLFATANIPSNSYHALSEYLNEACNVVKSILLDYEAQTKDTAFFGDYKGTISSNDLYIEVKDMFTDEEGSVFYTGKQSVYVGNKSFSRDFVCERSQFQGAVEEELYKRIN